MADPQYPTVPDAPGVPSVQNNGNPLDITTAEIVVTADKLPPPVLPPWGIYDSDGDPIATPDSFVDLDYAGSYSLSTYPVEKGGFQTYNKVERPFDARVTFAKGGASSDMQTFIGALEIARASTDLFSIVTPEQTFLSVSIEDFRYSRAAGKGAAMILAELAFLQVRVTATTTYSNTASPNGADAQSNGTVQTATPTGAQASAAAAGAS